MRLFVDGGQVFAHFADNNILTCPRHISQELEWREKQYDLRVYVDVFSEESGDTKPAVKGALTFIATPDKEANPNWLGSASLDSIAEQIAAARGPSGPNYEYLFGVAEAMRQVMRHCTDPCCIFVPMRIQHTHTHTHTHTCCTYDYHFPWPV